jgi:hypothetical protein
VRTSTKSHSGEFEFVPIGRASGWSVDAGTPDVWWWARLETLLNYPVLLSDGTDARKLDAVVTVSIGAEAPEGETQYTVDTDQFPKRGHVSYGEHSDSWIDVRIAVSRDTFARIQPTAAHAELPTVRVGFASSDAIRRDRIANSDKFVYHWDNAAKPVLLVETCRLRAARTAPDADDADRPEMPWQPPRAVRILGLASTAVTNIVAVAIAAAIFRTANTKFETAIVSLLLLTYVGAVFSSVAFGRMLLQMNMAAIVRFLQLRSLAGVAKTPEEEKFVMSGREKVAWLDVHLWINSVGSGVVGTIALYKLIGLFW